METRVASRLNDPGKSLRSTGRFPLAQCSATRKGSSGARRVTTGRNWVTSPFLSGLLDATCPGVTPPPGGGAGAKPSTPAARRKMATDGNTRLFMFVPRRERRGAPLKGRGSGSHGLFPSHPAPVGILSLTAEGSGYALGV